MGTDKSHLVIKGRTFTDHIVETIRQVFSSVTIVGQPTPDRRCDTIADVYSNWGALGGLHAALAYCRTAWAFVVACDLPFITNSLLARLASLTDNFEAVVPIQADGRLQPLCALYKIDPCLVTAERLIREGRRRPLDLIAAVNTRIVSFAELQDLDGSESFFVNINTPEDYYEVTKGDASSLADDH